ncbi:MAG: hypothetical protein K6A43_10825 [Treponema sp.]|nr:hypothetical protein [Treponema sp.]
MEMKKFISLLFTLLFVFGVFYSCRSVPESEPLWLVDLEQAYPQKEFFAKVGSGNSAADAILSAQTELASYFSTNIKQIVESTNLMEENTDGSVDKAKSVRVYAVSTTDLDFFAMEKTEPFYRKDDKKWYAAVYINRAKAWNQFEPLVRDSMNSFYSVFNLTKNQNDPLEKIKIYKAAQKEGEEFINRLYKAVILSKERTEKTFGEGRKTYASIPGLIQKEKGRCILYFNVNEDYAGMIRAKINQIFTNLKFPVTETESNAFYKVQVKLDYNQNNEEDLIVMNPSLNVHFLNGDGVKYVYDAALERVLSYNIDKAKKTSCSQAVQNLDDNLEKDFLLKTEIGK